MKAGADMNAAVSYVYAHVGCEEVQHVHMYISFNVYCSECPPGGTIGHLGGQQKQLLPFGHGSGLIAFNGTGL